MQARIERLESLKLAFKLAVGAAWSREASEAACSSLTLKTVPMLSTAYFVGVAVATVGVAS